MNWCGISADNRLVGEFGISGDFYTLYRAHNYHFVVYAAMMGGVKAQGVRVCVCVRLPEGYASVSGCVLMSAFLLA